MFIRSGKGVEIAPEQYPIELGQNCQTSYININKTAFSQPGEYTDNGEVLDSVENDSLDYIITVHILEHFQNPLQAIRNHLSKVKSGGWIYYIIPDRNLGSCDIERDLTPLQHIVDHYKRQTPPGNTDPGHLHVWDYTTAWEMFETGRNLLNDTYRIVLFMENHIQTEDIIILRKL